MRRATVQGQTWPLMVGNLLATFFRLVTPAQEEIDHLPSKLPDHRGPTLFAEDFNIFTPAYFRAVELPLKAIGLRYVHIPNDPQRSLGDLDQIFVRGLEVSDIHIDTRVQSSEHFPIRATVRIDAAG